jgi:hypothetical protein
MLPIVALAVQLAGPIGVLDSAWQAITDEGVFRASAVVDSVYIDRLLPAAAVSGGDFTAYLMARLGIRGLPPDFRYRVAVDSTQIRIGGRVSDLPGEARAALHPLVTWLAPEAWLEAQVALWPAGREAVRFHLRSVSVEGIPVPEAVLAPVLAGVGAQYPALTKTGRDLLVQIPPGAAMRLVPGGVVLVGP